MFSCMKQSEADEAGLSHLTNSFRQWPTYPVLAVLALTAIMQIIYLNKALRRFESRVVVPTQFVSFTISAITGSAILYRDFEDVQLGKVVAFCEFKLEPMTVFCMMLKPFINIVVGCALVFLGVVFLTSSQHTHSDKELVGDNSQSLTALESEGNDSSVTTSSIDSSGRLLDGVAMTSQPPPTAATYNLASSPAKVGRVLRKYNSIGMLPSKAGGATTAVATPIRAARAPALATSKLFSPGYLLIAGSGFGDISRDDSDDDHSNRETSEDLEAGLTRESSGDSSTRGSEEARLGGNENVFDAGSAEGGIGNRATGQDDDYEPMTRSALMRRSGTV